MGPGYIAIGMREPRDHGHKRVCYALVNRESPSRCLLLTTGSPPTTIAHRKTSILRLLSIVDDTGTVWSESTYTVIHIAIHILSSSLKPVRASSFLRLNSFTQLTFLRFPSKRDILREKNCSLYRHN